MPRRNIPQFLPKMHLSESPLEALAFRYSVALACCVWAWIAVVFAALSLWRIRAVGSTGANPDPQPELPKKLTAMPAPTVTARPAGNKLLTASPSCPVKGGDWGVTKGRFTAYFHREGDGDEIEAESDVDCEEETETPAWRCEGMRGDLGWYRYVDLTALDGSVVRLWDRDGGLRRRLM